MSSEKPIVLILCTGNSCRSHLAEGILRSVAGDFLDVQSAGSKPAGYVHPLAIRAMQEIGIDISAHRSKSMGEFAYKPVETVITVCGNADAACPIFPGQLNRHHWPFADPAHATGTEEEPPSELPAWLCWFAAPFALVHLIVAIGVLRDRLPGSARFAPKLVWALAVLLGGLVPLLIYWTIHHSTLARPANHDQPPVLPD